MPDPIGGFPDDQDLLPRPTAPIGLDRTRPDPGRGFPDDEPDPLRQLIGNAAQTTPDTAAKVFRLRLKTGLTPSVIERNLDQVERATARADFDPDRFRRENPHLSRWILDEPSRASLVQDDLEPLSALERTLQIGARSARALAAGTVGAASGLFGGLRAASEWVGDEEKAAFYQNLSAVSDHIRQQIAGSRAGAGFVERTAYGGMESIAPTLMVLPAAAIGGPAAAVGLMGAVAAGQMYGRARETRGVGVSSALAGWEGLVEAATEFLPAKWILKDLASNASFRQILTHQMKTEVLQEQIATALQDLGEWVGLRPDATFMDYLRERPSAIAETLIATVVAVGGQSAIVSGLQRLSGKSASEQVVEDLHKATEAVTIRETAPEALQDFVAQAAASGLTHVYVPAAESAEYFQSKGENTAQIFAALTGGPEAFQLAMETGGDVAIPTAAYLTQIVGSGHEAFFAKELRLSPDSPNGRETQEQLKAEAETAEASPDEDVASRQREQADLKTALTSRIMATGRASQIEADTLATLAAEAFPTAADRAGLDLGALAERWLPQVQAGEPGVQAANELQQAPAPTFYSRLTKAVESTSQAKASGAQWTATIRNAKSGINQDEFALARVEDLDPGKSYTKQEVLEYLAANQVQVQDVTLGEANVSLEIERRAALAQFGTFSELQQSLRAKYGSDAAVIDKASGAELRALEVLGGGTNASPERTTQFASYQLPGADEGSYREVFLTVPTILTEDQRAFQRDSAVQLESANDAIRDWVRDHPDAIPARDATLSRLTAVRDRIVNETPIIATNIWQDGHSAYSAIANPIVRLRFNTRTAGDQRVLFLEEVQPPNATNQKKMPALFVKHWREIAFKWALRHAAEQNLDAVAWTTGEQQAERYSLQKQVKEIAWTTFLEGSPARANGERQFVVIQPTGGEYPIRLGISDTGVVVDGGTYGKEFVGKPIDQVIGKEVADRILASEEGTLKGEGLKTGGEGLKKLYDVDFRNVVNSLPAVKRNGGKVGTVEIPGVGERTNETSYELHPPRVASTQPALVLTPELRASVLAGQALFQGPRGSISGLGPNDTSPLIKLFRAKNRSTLFHEFGHLFLSMYRDIAGQLGAVETRTGSQQQIVDDVAALDAWFESPDADQQQEQFARGFEAFVIEGKAPSTALRGVFARARSWLLRIYQSVAGISREAGFAVELTDEVRGVMARMLASDVAIAEAEQDAGVQALFTTAEQAQVPETEFEGYRALAQTAHDARVSQLQTRVMKDLLREEKDWWKTEKAAVRAEVTAEVHAQPVYRALSAIRKGTKPDGSPLIEGEITPPMKLSKAALVEQFGPDILARLPRPFDVQAIEAEGLSPDLVAGMFAFEDGRALVDAIIAAPPMNRTIVEQTDARMRERHGDLLTNPVALAEQAQQAIAEDHRDTVIRAEVAMLRKLQAATAPVKAEAKAKSREGARRLRTELPDAATLKRGAAEQIASMKLRDIRPDRFFAAAKRGSRLATQAAAKQKFDEAIQAKRTELINLALYREALAARDQADKDAKYAAGLAEPAAQKRLGLAGGNYLAQVLGVLDRYDFAQVSGPELDRRQGTREWVESLHGEGIPANLPAALLNDLTRVNWRDLTPAQLTEVTDGLRQIVHLARLKNRLLASLDQRTFDAVRDGLTDSIRTHNTTRHAPPEFRPSDERWRQVAGWFASHRKIAMLARAFDGHQDGGAFWSAIIRPINAAADAKQARNVTEATAYAAIMEQYYPGRELGRMGDKVYIAALGTSLSKEARLAVGLNQGNPTNQQRVVNDTSRKWTPAHVDAILDTLDARDWQFITATWQYVDHFWPEIAAKMQRLTGLPPEKVEAVPFRTKFGIVPGGYYPIAYDARLSISHGQNTAASEIKLGIAANYVAATTRRGHLEERVKRTSLPLKLELGVVFAHIDQVIHDLTHHEMLIDVTRLLRDDAVRSAILQTRGDTAYAQFTSALEDIALGSLSDKNDLDRAASWMRERTQIALLGWNLWTAAQQPLGLFNGMSRVGVGWVSRGMRRWLRDAASMQSTTQWINEVSPLMRSRGLTATQDLADLRQAFRQPGGWFDTLLRTMSKDHVTQQTILDGYLWHIGVMQRVADVPTWLGAYEKAMAAEPDEPRAIALADQAVLDAQGGGQIKDLAAVQRGGGVARLYMTFYSYGSTVHNSTMDVAGATNFKSPASIATFLGHLSLLYVFPAMGTVALMYATGRAGGDDDEEGWARYFTLVAREMASTALNGLVFVRELTALAGEGTRGYAGPAGARLIQLMVSLGQQIKQGEADAALLKATNQVGGILFRYPAAQVERTVNGWIALREGRTSNPAALFVGPPPRAQ